MRLLLLCLSSIIFASCKTASGPSTTGSIRGCLSLLEGGLKTSLSLDHGIPCYSSKDDFDHVNTVVYGGKNNGYIIVASKSKDEFAIYDSETGKIR
jgi:hypothetical protein